jgi:hypothetical protein
MATLSDDLAGMNIDSPVLSMLRWVQDVPVAGIMSVDVERGLWTSQATKATLVALGLNLLRVAVNSAPEAVAASPCRQTAGSSLLASRCRHGGLLERTANLQDRRRSITKWRAAFRGLISAAALLVPFMAAADSHLQTKAIDAKFITSAHVDFKIIIPPVIYLELRTGNERGKGPVRMHVMSNSRAVALHASVRTSDIGGSTSSTPTSLNSPAARPTSVVTASTPVSGEGGGRSVVLNAAARKIIAQDEECMVGDAHAAAAPANPQSSADVRAAMAYCTVSMP